MTDESEICDSCSGSGEGAYDGATCGTCKGWGEYRTDEHIKEPDDDGDDSFTDQAYDDAADRYFARYWGE
jgi:RecJ-like exonuclease